MKRLLMAGLALAPLAATAALAERCVRPMDSSGMVTTTYGITPVNPSSIVFCDDFDSYCTANYNGGPPTGPNSNRNLSAFWPGFPPTPDNLCASPTDGYEWMVKEGFWSQPPTQYGPSGWSAPLSRNTWSCLFSDPCPGNNCSCGTTAVGTPGVTNFGVSNAGAGGLRLEGWNGNGGWASTPYVVVQAGNNHGNTAYYDFLLGEAINHRLPGSNTVNGTDENPLVLRFWLHDNATLGAPAGWGKPANWPFYMELALDSDRAPTDYVMAATGIAQCVNEVVNWPIICQQVARPAFCPDATAFPPANHASIAFGWLAPLDTNPCDVETGRSPTQYHAASFDGKLWHQLIQGTQGIPVNSKFNYGMQQSFFEITIKTNTYDLRLVAPRCTNDACTAAEVVTSTASFTRQYTGPFNKIAMGIGMGCELDPLTGDCKTGTVRRNNVWTWDWGNVYADGIVLFGGVGNNTPGPCCQTNGQCVEVSPSECSSLGGSFGDLGATCAQTTCCPHGPYVWADKDADGDVDMDDFAALQRCYTGTGGGVSADCACFDRVASDPSGINVDDFTAFTNCVSGASVPWSLAVAPFCVP